MEVSPARGLRVDVMALAEDGRILVVECKASAADWRADAKWRGYLPWCDAFWFAVDEAFPTDLLPPDEGLLIADAFTAAEVRPPAPTKLAPARRASLTKLLARTAALRLRRVLDPAP